MQELGYDGYASFEPNIADRNYEAATKGGLEFMKRIELDRRKAAAV
jgi:hypothetical protein